MDFQKGIFAVADGAGRASGASQRLMAKFGDLAAGFTALDQADTLYANDRGNILERFKAAVESILAEIPYGDATTLTALMLLRSKTETTGILCHCGDSLLYQFELRTGLRQVSRTNFWMAGRTKQVYQAEAFSAPTGTIFLLTTDGISDLKFPEPLYIEACLMQSIQETRVDQIPHELLTRYDHSHQPVDDVAMIVVNPEALRTSNEQIFLDVHGVHRRVLDKESISLGRHQMCNGDKT